VPLKRILEKYGIYIFMFLLLIVASIASPAFLNPSNLRDVFNQVAPLAIVGIGQTFVILAGNEGIDLSVASVMCAVAVIAAIVMEGQNSMFLPVSLLCLLFGLFVGLINGLLITKRKTPPVMTTLGMMILVQGFRYIYSGGAPTGDFPPIMRFLATGSILGFPASMITLSIIGAISIIILRKTNLGRQIYATGGNINTAKLCGYNTDFILTLVYMISGFCSAIAGLYLGGWVGVVDLNVGYGYEIDSIAVVVMGGTSFEGGRGGVLGTIAGVIILRVLYNIILLMHFPITAQYVVKGAVIVLAAYFYTRRKRR